MEGVAGSKKDEKIPLAKASRPVIGFLWLSSFNMPEQLPGDYMVRHVRYPHEKMGGRNQMTCPTETTRVGN